MNLFINAIQPFLDMMHSLYMLMFIAIGVMAAFSLRYFVFAVIFPVCLIFITSTISNVLPGISTEITNYIVGLAIGLVAGNVVKWIWSIFIRHII